MKRLKTILPLVCIILLLLLRNFLFGIDDGTTTGNDSHLLVNDSKAVNSSSSQSDLLTNPATNEITKIAAVARSVQHVELSAKRQPTNDLTRTAGTNSGHNPPVQDFVEPQDLLSSAYGVLLQAGALDSRKGPVNIPEELRLNPANIVPGQSIRYLIQFTGPVQPQWKESPKAWAMAWCPKQIPTSFVRPLAARSQSSSSPIHGSLS